MATDMASTRTGRQPGKQACKQQASHVWDSCCMRSASLSSHPSSDPCAKIDWGRSVGEGGRDEEHVEQIHSRATRPTNQPHVMLSRMEDKEKEGKWHCHHECTNV